MTELDRDQLQKDIIAMYTREHEELGDAGTLEHLERGRQWDLSGTLASGGVLVFPHAGVKDCGYQIAAAGQPVALPLAADARFYHGITVADYDGRPEGAIA